VTLLGILAAILLPSLSRAREASHRASCQNNLKQLGIVLKMYANESKGEVFPPLSPLPGNFMMDMRAVYPEYLTDLNVLICPSNLFGTPNTFQLRGTIEHPGAEVGALHPDCVTGLFYNYTGFAIIGDELAVGFFDAYLTNTTGISEESQLTIRMPEFPDTPASLDTTGFGQSGIPVMWDRVPLTEYEIAHVPGGGNVLHMDGHVEFVKYSYYNPSNFFPITRLSAETFGSLLPEVSVDCYGF
jgi:prepilin-type processing-associated H-X9-DG protein